MLKNYFKSSWRYLSRNKFSSFINIGGLAVGMAVAFLIALWIHDELSYNKYHKNYKRVARLMQHQTNNGIVHSLYAMPFPLADELRNTYKEDFKYVVMASWSAEHILTYGDKTFSKSGLFMQKDAGKLLSLKMVRGNQDGLNDMNSIMLSASNSKAFFGDEDPINKVIRVDNKYNVKVTGVYEDLPVNSEFSNLSLIIPFDLMGANEQWMQEASQQWDNNSFQIYAQIADNTNFKTVDRKIINSKQVHVAPQDKKYDSKIFLHPMADWHLRSHWDDNGIQTGGLIEFVWLFSIIGGFVLLLACINFMNLSTAQSEKRAKEVGIRKTIGSARSQLIRQFFSESILVVIFAFLVAVVLAWIGLPFFNDLSSKHITIPWTEPLFWIAATAFILITGVVAGSYPAYYLSSFRPVKVLKGTFKTGRLASIPRKALVVLQFTVSAALIIGTIIVYRQVQYSKNRPVGYNRNGLIMTEMKSGDYYGKSNLLRNELINSGALIEYGETSSPVTNIWSYNDGMTWPGKDPNLDVSFATIWSTHDYGKTVGWEFTQGRDFSRQYVTDSSGIVINEATLKFMGLKDPVGKVITWNNRNYTILGVIKDMIMSSPYEAAKETVYMLDYNSVNWMVMKLNPRKSANESLAKIAATFKKYIPSAPFDYKFVDQEFAQKFGAEERVGKLSTFFAALAILISCLGLFGLTSFVAEQRKKEIGVRKVLGATVFNVWRLLSKEFVILVFISLLVAIPLAYYFMNDWLMRYNYRTSLSWWVFAAAGAGTLLITLLTVSFQSIKAAIANPVRSLRSE